jgi:hypothetical protein
MKMGTVLPWLLVGALLAGCADRDDPQLPSSTTTGPNPSQTETQSSTVSHPPPVGAGPIGLNDCRRIMTNFFVDASAADALVPEQFDIQDLGPVIQVYFEVDECASMTVGNGTVIEPFAQTKVMIPVRARGNYTGFENRYVIEHIVGDVEAVDVFLERGWSVTSGSVDLIETPGGWDWIVRSDGSDYTASLIETEATDGAPHPEDTVLFEAGPSGMRAIEIDEYQRRANDVTQTTVVRLNRGPVAEIALSPANPASSGIYITFETWRILSCDDAVLECEGD